MNQIELFKQIDEFFKNGLDKAKKEQAQKFIDANRSAKEYFFAKAPVEWVNWFYTNRFFDCVNAEAENKKSYGYTMPELGYLEGVVVDGGDIETVVKIIKEVDCYANFNPEVVQRFLNICRELPITQLIDVLSKAKEEHWVYLMKDFQHSGYAYDLLVKKLVKAKSSKGVLSLAQVVLELNKEKTKGDYTDGYFYIKDISRSGLFEALLELEGEDLELGVEMFAKIFSEFIQSETSEDSAFEYSDSYYINDVNFFDLTFKGRTPYGFKEDLKDALRTFASLVNKSISGGCDKKDKRIYEKYIKTLPDSQTLWRIKLFAMSKCPNLFEADILEALNRIFTASRYSQLLFGTEFISLLKMTFPGWGEEVQRDYAAKLLDKFNKLIKEKPKEHWHIEQGWELFSVIAPSLTQEERKDADGLFGKKVKDDFEPKLITPEVRGGMVVPRSPRNLSESKTVTEVVSLLEGELNEEALKELKGNDFLRPINVEGVADELKVDMKKRLKAYAAEATRFVGEKMHIHYTYAFLRGVEDCLREGMKLDGDDWDQLFALFDMVVGREVEEDDDEDRWLASITWAEKVVAEILQLFLTKTYEDYFDDKRELSLDLIKKLLKNKDPLPKQENDDHGDLFHIAINSVRGKAFEDLVNFVYLDGKTLDEEVASLYEEVIDEASPSVRFLIGRYVVSFYYRNEDKVSQLFTKIFPIEEERKGDFCIAWEGYLTNSLYKELFDELKEHYEYGLTVDATNYPREKTVQDIDTGIGTHLALAFSHFKEIRYDKRKKHKLLEMLFSQASVNKQKEFISFLGRGVISHSEAGDAWFKEQHINLEKLKTLWELLLSKDLDRKVFSAFGFWVNHRVDIFDYRWLANMVAATLKKADGDIEWDHGIESRLDKFAEVNPKATISIIRSIFLDKLINSQRLNWFSLGKEVDVFKVLYGAEPDATKDLISELMEKGGRPFWELRNIVE